MRKGLSLLAVVLLGLVLAALIFRGSLAQRAFDRAVDANVGVDRSLALGDGLQVYVCGSGSPLPDETRAGPCIAVLAGNDGFVFDSGSGSTRKLLRVGFPIAKLRGVYLTHLHSDHIDGLGELLLQAWVGGSRATPLPVSGPPGTERVIAGLAEAYALDRGFRIAHHGPAVVRPSGAGATAQIVTLPAGAPSMVVYDQAGVRITAILVDHRPIAPAYGYRIDYKGRSVALSGDTVYAPAFVAAAKGVDVMFHDALNAKMVGAIGAKLAERGNADAARIMHDIPGYHASPTDAARAARDAGAKTLVLYHMVPPVPSRLIERLFLDGAGKVFPGTLKLAHDGMIVSLPAGGSAIRFSDGF